MVYYGDNDYRDYLAHHGVKGMKWGIRRYQPYSYTGGSGKEVGLARRRSHVKGGDAVKDVARTVGKVAKTIGRAAKKVAVKGGEIYAARKAKKIEKIVRSGSLKQVKKNRRKLTTQELTDAYNRIEKELKVEDLKRENRIKSVERGRRAIESMASTISSTAKMYKDVKSVADGIKAAKSDKKADAVIRTGDVDKILKALPTMTDEQAQRALKRLENKAGLEKIRDKQQGKQQQGKQQGKQQQSEQQQAKQESEQQQAKQQKNQNGEQTNAQGNVGTYYDFRGASISSFDNSQNTKTGKKKTGKKKKKK